MVQYSFEESIRSYAKRLETEAKFILDCIDEKLNKTDDPYIIRQAVNDLRKAENKINMYISYIEGLNERKITNAKKSDNLNR